MNDNTDNIMPLEEARIARLGKKRREILALPADQALNAILDFPEPMPLVHSFSRQDFYFLIHEIGLADALPILSLASDRQWEYLLDMDIWEKDQISAPALIEHLGLFLQADPARLTRWLSTANLDLFEFCLLKNVVVRVREQDQDPSIFGEDFITFDDVFYFKILDSHEEELPAGHVGLTPDTNALLDVLKRLVEDNYDRFRRILVESSNLLPAEAEEALYRWRNVRLAESGLLPYEEAIGIYQPLRASEREDLEKRDDVRIDPASVSLSLAPIVLLGPDEWLVKGIETIDDPALAEEIRTEFVALCNRLIIADQQRVKDRNDLLEIILKARGYLTIGMERLTGNTVPLGAEAVGSILRAHPLHEIFRVGYDRVTKLKQRVEKWLRHESWFRRNHLPLSFWGENWIGVLGGILLKRPLYYDNYENGVLYRDFHATPDIERTEVVLEDIYAMDGLLSRMNISVQALGSVHSLSYKNVILTHWACHRLAIVPPGPIPLKQFRDFFEDLFLPETVAGKIGKGMKQAFLTWLAKESRSSQNEITSMAGTVFERLFAEMETEYGAVAAEHVDPRFIQLFIIK